MDQPQETGMEALLEQCWKVSGHAAQPLKRVENRCQMISRWQWERRTCEEYWVSTCKASTGVGVDGFHPKGAFGSQRGNVWSLARSGYPISESITSERPIALLPTPKKVAVAESACWLLKVGDKKQGWNWMLLKEVNVVLEELTAWGDKQTSGCE